MPVNVIFLHHQTLFKKKWLSQESHSIFNQLRIILFVTKFLNNRLSNSGI